MKTWRLGLDLGTNSIGWAALRIDGDEQVDLLDMGVRIFTDGRNPKNGEPLAVARRTARMARRILERRKRRKKAMLLLCTTSGLFGKEPSKMKETAKLYDPYKLRSEALGRKLEPAELARVLLNIAAHRGFKSNRKSPVSDEKELGKNNSKIVALQTQLGSKTLGQFLFEKLQQGQPVRFRPGFSEFYPSRAMYDDEFNRIRSNQQQWFPDFSWDKAYRIIFFQRPLKPQERGKCEFYRDEFRAHKAIPSAQLFRILSDLSNLAFVDTSGNTIFLSDDEKDILLKKLQSQKSLGFGAIRSLLKISGECRFNLESERRKELQGNISSVSIRGVLADKWDQLPIEDQDELVEALLMEDEKSINTFAEKLNLDASTIGKLFEATASLPMSTSSLSARFMRDCCEIMQKQRISYVQSCAVMGFSHSDRSSVKKYDTLPYYGEVLPDQMLGAKGSSATGNPEEIFGKINNPTVHIVQNQLRKLINALIARFGKPAEIALEIGRDLKLSQEKIREIERIQEANQKDNEKIDATLKTLGIERPASADRKKYKLWQELGQNETTRKCIYCGRTISLSELYTAAIEVEHILPYSRTLNDSTGNLTVAHKTCNNEKKNQSPYEAFSSSPRGFVWQDILGRATACRKEKLFAKEAMQKYDNLEAGFLERQKNDTAYIARFAKEYLSAICPGNKIWVSAGRLTATARALWGLDAILNRKGTTWFKNRSDHRHHAVDALVIALVDRSIIQKAAIASKHNGRPSVPPLPIPLQKVQDQLSDTLVSIKPDHGYQGAFLKDTALGLHKYRIKVESGLELSDVDKLVSEKARQRITERIKAVGKKEAMREIVYPVWIEKTRYVSSMPLSDLSEKDLEKSERIIADPVIDQQIREHWNKASEKGTKWKEFITEFAEKTSIRRIRYFPKDQQGAIAIASCDDSKSYMPDENLFADVWLIPPHKGQKQKIIGSFVTLFEANHHAEAFRKGLAKNQDFPLDRPHPAAKHLGRYYKGDIIRLTIGAGRQEFAIIKGYSTKDNRMDIRPLHCTDDAETWMCDTNPRLCYSEVFKSKKGQNHVSINSFFSEYRVKKVTITVDGRLLVR